jgi:hypothetical protein
VTGQSTPAEWAAQASACVSQAATDAIDPQPRTDIDVLILLQNSPSSDEEQSALANAAPGFIQALDATGINYHIGIATSDVGSWPTAAGGWNNLGACDTYAGDDGTLQTTPCTNRTFTSPNAPAECMTLCPDPSYLPQGGDSFISKVNGINNVKSTDPMAPLKAFQCMALIGDQGCGIDGHFEGAKRALDGHNQANRGFLRDDSVLAVIYLASRDDCSVSPAGRVDNAPDTMDCSTPEQNAPWNCYNPSYRCLAASVQCDQPLNQPGAKTGCHERAQSYLNPVSTYTSFFKGLRRADHLLVAGIWSPPMIPDAINNTTNDTGQFNAVYENGGTTSDTLNTDVEMNAACYNVADSTIYGHPQLRLLALATQFPGSIEASVCDTGNYPAAFSRIAGELGRKLVVNCTSGVPLIEGGRPDCLVGAVDAATPTALPTTALPLCSAACCQGFATAQTPSASDPGVAAACASDTAACYCAVPSTAGACPGAAVAGIWPVAALPPNQVASFTCRNNQ